MISLELHPMSDTAKSLSLERKIKMQEARDGIINRLALTLPTTINLDRFLNVIVSELGRMMNVDRCDVIQLTSPSERISHEWRASEENHIKSQRFRSTWANFRNT